MRHIFYGLGWVPAVAVSLLLLALLTGGVWDGRGESALASSAQPANAIFGGQEGVGPQQAACPSGLPWLLPIGDTDCDGFSTTLELHVGTHGTCAAGLPSSWPADLSNDGFSDITDVSAMTANFGESILNAPVRQDIGPEPAGDGIIDITDVAAMTEFFGLRAADFLPLCPPA